MSFSQGHKKKTRRFGVRRRVRSESRLHAEYVEPWQPTRIRFPRRQRQQRWSFFLEDSQNFLEKPSREKFFITKPAEKNGISISNEIMLISTGAWEFSSRNYESTHPWASQRQFSRRVSWKKKKLFSFSF